MVILVFIPNHTHLNTLNNVLFKVQSHHQNGLRALQDQYIDKAVEMVKIKTGHDRHALLPADVLVDGITNRPASAERRGRAGEYGRRSSDKYKGADPFSDLNVNLFSYYVTNSWNKLPEDLRLASTLTTLKTRLKKTFL